jgi:hypothetical protein
MRDALSGNASTTATCPKQTSLGQRLAREFLDGEEVDHYRSTQSDWSGRASLSAATSAPGAQVPRPGEARPAYQQKQMQPYSSYGTLPAGGLGPQRAKRSPMLVRRQSAPQWLLPGEDAQIEAQPGQSMRRV